uniref:Uncharacterized protein n=1 Tax=Arundo donax TaxID=35708 RepID=A0A0A9H5Q4_ARUDO
MGYVKFLCHRKLELKLVVLYRTSTFNNNPNNCSDMEAKSSAATQTGIQLRNLYS